MHFIGPMLFALALSNVDLFEFKLSSMILAFLGWGMASHAFGAVQDVRADREAGIKSVATAIGARNTVRFAFLLYFLAGISIMNVGPHGMVAALAAIPYLVIISPYLSITDEDCERANRGWRKFIWLNFAGGALISILLINYVQAL
jgi:4-hydroxybenzoate polyprenyltransferase